jgi:hypothetical protein
MPVDHNPTITMSADPPSQRALAETRFLTDAATLQDQRKLSEADALEEAARLDPGNYRRVRGYNTGYLTEPSTSLSGEASKRFAELIEAKVNASGGTLTYGDASNQVAEERPELFNAYRAEWSHV